MVGNNKQLGDFLYTPGGPEITSVMYVQGTADNTSQAKTLI